MNNQVLKEYVLFAIVTVLVGLIVCEIICSYYPEIDKFHSGDNKYLCISVLAITGLIIRYLLTTKMGEDNLYSTSKDTMNKKLSKIQDEANKKIAQVLALANTPKMEAPKNA
jgi:hypothetical protein